MNNTIQVQITNCQNIKSGTIEIHPGKLNIKYAINGTGKSTIGKALSYKEENELLSLLPFMYHNEAPLDKNHKPKVQCTNRPNNIAIFNEDTVEQYLFQPNDLIKNSFDVLIRTADYEKRMLEIEELIKDIKKAFQENPVLDELITQFKTFLDDCKTTKTGLSKASKIYKGLGQGGKLDNVPDDLKDYKSFITGKNNLKWLSWQAQGNQYLESTVKCPYCVTNLKPEQPNTIRRVSEVYESKQIEHFLSVANLLETLKPYFTDSTAALLDEILHGKIEFSTEHEGFLSRLRNQIDDLYQKLVQSRYMNFNSFKNVDKVIEELRKNKINLSFLDSLNSATTQQKINIINDSLDKVIDKAGLLQGEIAKQKAHIKTTIDLHKEKINQFLETAGYQYQVDIIPENKDDSYHLILRHIACDQPLDNAKSCLSFGERNAFALVLFMYSSLKENSDLIILDDPISSFDNHKKFAIIDMLFRRKNSFQGKTVLMLTHDFEPLVDMIRTLSHLFSPPPFATYLYNDGNILTETAIEKTDIQSIIDVTKNNIVNSHSTIVRLIYLRRLLEMNDEKNIIWQLLSNIFHGRPTPLDQDKNPIPAEDIADGEERICLEVPEFSYPSVYTMVQDKLQMISLYKVCTGYEKLQIYRILYDEDIKEDSPVFRKFINETYHIGNESFYQLNPQKFQLVPQYIIDLCDNDVALLEVKLNNLT